MLIVRVGVKVGSYKVVLIASMLKLGESGTRFSFVWSKT